MAQATESHGKAMPCSSLEDALLLGHFSFRIRLLKNKSKVANTFHMALTSLPSLWVLMYLPKGPLFLSQEKRKAYSQILLSFCFVRLRAHELSLLGIVFASSRECLISAT